MHLASSATVFVLLPPLLLRKYKDMKSGQGLETWADGSTFKGEYRPACFRAANLVSANVVRPLCAIMQY